MNIRVFSLAALLCSCTVLGQSIGTLSGPAYGYIFDKNALAVRPLLGIPGSTTIGAPIELGFPISRALSLSDRRMLVAPESGEDWIWVDLEVSPPISRTITGAEKSALIRLSPTGRSAVLADEVRKTVHVIAGLPDRPALTFAIPTDGMHGSLQDAAINDAGDVLLMAFQENDHETIYRWNETEGFRVLAAAKSIGAMSFVGSSDAVYADRGTNEVFLATDLTKQSVVRFLVGSEDGVSDPIGLNASVTGGVFLANSTNGTVLRFDTAGRIVQTLACSCNLSGIYPLAPGIFRLTEPLNQTIQLLDDRGTEKRFVFIPALR